MPALAVSVLRMREFAHPGPCDSTIFWEGVRGQAVGEGVLKSPTAKRPSPMLAYNTHSLLMDPDIAS